MTASPVGVSPDVVTALVVLKAGILVFGGFITYLSYKAYRTTGSPELRSLSAGFAIVTLGALLGGFADQILHVDLDVGVLVDSALTMVGFLVITYSLYRE